LTAFTLVVPGALDQLTGGYLFDRQVVDGLRAIGRTVTVVELPGTFPQADDTARAAAASVLADLPSGDVVVIDGLALPAFDDCLAAHVGRLRVIGFIHHPLSLETGLAADAVRACAELEARLWPLLQGVLCPSAHTAHAVIDAGASALKVMVTPPGTRRPPAAITNSLGAQRSVVPRTLHLLAVGTVTPRKGHLILVEALSGLHDIDWQLVCIGSLARDPAAVQALQSAIRAHRLEQRVTLAGEVSAPRLDAAYREADVFVLPSSHEGYGMVYAEALAYHLPVIATTAGAIPSTVPSDASLLVAPGDPSALEDALRRVLTDASLRARLAEGAARAAQQLSDWPAAVRRWADACDRLAA
jgi:glycosyltransferase involved in cell wall biosynthesis